MVVGRAGVWVGVAFCLAHEVASHQIESGYLANPYHNNIHAADVTQTMSFFITKPFLLPYVKPLEILASLLAAAIHDYRHPGLNNAFHVAISHSLAIRYNDKSVLEAYHVAEFFSLVKNEAYNALAGLQRTEFNELRSLMIDMVLGTDMAHHFEETAKFKSKLLQVARNKEQVRCVDARCCFPSPRLPRADNHVHVVWRRTPAVTSPPTRTRTCT